MNQIPFNHLSSLIDTVSYQENESVEVCFPTENLPKNKRLIELYNKLPTLDNENKVMFISVEYYKVGGYLIHAEYLQINRHNNYPLPVFIDVYPEEYRNWSNKAYSKEAKTMPSFIHFEHHYLLHILKDKSIMEFNINSDLIDDNEYKEKLINQIMSYKNIYYFNLSLEQQLPLKNDSEKINKI